MRKAFSLVDGQYTEYIRAKLQPLPNWQTIKDQYDVLGLLQAVKGVIYAFDGESYEYFAMYQAQ